MASTTAEAPRLAGAATASSTFAGHASAFDDYKPWRELTRSDWRTVNDTVRDAGALPGHGHAHPPGAPR